MKQLYVDSSPISHVDTTFWGFVEKVKVWITYFRAIRWTPTPTLTRDWPEKKKKAWLCIEKKKNPKTKQKTTLWIHSTQLLNIIAFVVYCSIIKHEHTTYHRLGKKRLRTLFVLWDTMKISIKNSEYSSKHSSASRSTDFLFHVVFFFYIGQR